VASKSPAALPARQQEVPQPLPLRYGESRRALPSDRRLSWLYVSFYLA
jgi:hypothetical protein